MGAEMYCGRVWSGVDIMWVDNKMHHNMGRFFLLFGVKNCQCEKAVAFVLEDLNKGGDVHGGKIGYVFEYAASWSGGRRNLIRVGSQFCWSGVW